MKAKSKYGSAYPESALTQANRVNNRHKTEPSAPTTEDTAELKLPHERDEAVDRSGGAVPSESVEQAGRDVKRGLPDTDRGAEMNHTYQKQKRQLL